MVALDLFLAVVGLLGDDAECFFLLVGVYGGGLAADGVEDM